MVVRSCKEPSSIGSIVSRYERDIRDASGTVWRFQTRQFRSTVIAQMINDGVPLHHIQYYWNMQTLDEVMSVYKQVFGPPRKDAFFPLLTTIADGKGKCGELRELFERVKVPWINKNALPPNEPFGCCTLPPTVCLRPHIYPCLVEGCFFRRNMKHPVNLQEQHYTLLPCHT
jgi:integrase/recombinase XerD